jgi:cytidylate kinase
MNNIIAIDGPASSGKSSLAKKISNYYGSPLLNSGKLYRAVAFQVQNENININDKSSITKIAKSLTDVDLNSKKLFSSEIDRISSKISAKKYLRDLLKIYQREFSKKYHKYKKYVIIEGRDIGTEIFPDAKYKIFLWADAKIRAMRRYEQIKKKGQKSYLSTLYKEIIERDNKDLNRKIAPLKPAANSVLLDTSYLDIEQTFNAIKIILKNKYETRVYRSK